jgi:dihydroorotase
MHTLTINKPDDWHIHLRDGDVLRHTVSDIAKHFGRALVMPNLQPALTTAVSLMNYRDRILAACPPGAEFSPYMTLYLNESVTPQDIKQAAFSEFILGAKFYPAGATTHSEEGAQSLQALYPILEVLQQLDLVLQIHGEVTKGDIFEREALFIDKHLLPLIKQFPTLRMVLEHISTKEAVDFVTAAPNTIAATITPQHLLYNRNILLAGGIRPHYYCLPVLKHERHQNALRHAAVSGNPKFFAGTDSAPHALHTKENACGCAGVYSAPFAVALYAEVFDTMNQLNRLNDFMSRFGADFYQLPRATGTIELIKSPQIIPQSLNFGTDSVVPIAAGNTIAWSTHESK